MASKKQRRRQQKLKRHEYEEVYVDEEGRVLEPEEAEELVGSDEARPPEPREGAARSSAGADARSSPRRFAGRRSAALVFFPLMLAVIFLLPARRTRRRSARCSTPSS